MRQLWNKLVDWLENGDLVPLIIGVSVPHYVGVLDRHDWWLVAAVLGFLVDLGHYRTIKSFLRGKGVAWMIALTVVSYGFHVVFYLESANGWAWALGIVVPVLLFALAYLSYNERWGDKARRNTRKVAEISGKENQENNGTRWNELKPEDFMFISENTTNSIASTYGVTQRTARNWKSKVGVTSTPSNGGDVDEMEW